MPKLVSVIIPLYNSENYITQTINSVLNQTYKNFEIIIIDDGSTDSSYNIAKSFEANNVMVYTQKNKGACCARNYGFELSKGSIIQYLDADDLLSENYLEEKVNKFNLYGDKIIVTSYLYQFKESITTSNLLSPKVSKSYLQPLNLIIDMAKYSQPFQVSAWCITRKLQELAGKWDESLLRNQDGEMFIRLILKCNGVFFCNRTLSYYRNTPFSITNSKITDEKISSLISSIDKYSENILNYNDTLMSRKAVVRFYTGIFSTVKRVNQDKYEEVMLRIKNIYPLPLFGGNIILRLLSHFKYIEYVLRIIIIKSK